MAYQILLGSCGWLITATMRRLPYSTPSPTFLHSSADVWDAEIMPMLKAAPDLRAVAIFEEILRRHPEIAPGVRRTMERRIRKWRALNGPEQDVIFGRNIGQAGWGFPISPT